MSVTAKGSLKGKVVVDSVIKGERGEPGATFTPAIDQDGYLSWTNDAGLENPSPVNVIGPTGPQGEPGKDGTDGKDYVLTEADKTEIAGIAAEMVEIPELGASGWNDLTDKPFGEEQAFEPIVWDGNTEGLESIDIGPLLGVDTFPVFKIATSTLPASQYDGASICDLSHTPGPNIKPIQILELMNGSTDTARLYTFDFGYLENSEQNEWSSYCDGVFVVVTGENAYGAPVGIYVNSMETHIGYEKYLPVKIYKEIVKPLDEKYIPNTIARVSDLPTIPEGPVGSGSIIDVVELPTENIREDCFYRLMSGHYIYNQYFHDNFTVHCVETLPEVGLPATNADISDGNIYYCISDGIAYGYIDDMLSMGMGVPAGWYDADALIGAMGYTYGGVIADINDDPCDDVWRVLICKDYYIYQDGWCKLPFACEKAPKYNITWDGDMTGRPALDMSMLGFAQGLYFVKVSDDVFTTDELVGWHYAGRGYDGGIFESEIYSNDLDTQTYPGAISISNTIVIVYDDELLATALGIPTGIYTNGVYFWLYTDSDEGGYVSNLTSPVRITKIESKYLDVDVDLDVDSLGLASVATSGNYNDLYNRPNLSDYATLSFLNNNFVTTSKVETMISNAIGSAIGGSY